MNWYHVTEFQKCTEKSKKKLLLYLQLNRRWYRPSELDGNMTGVHWTTDYQRKKALGELLHSGVIECKFFQRGHFAYYAYRAIKEITLEQYRIEDEK